jgi:hypothetical protein
MVSPIPVKIGETFAADMTFANDDGSPFDLTPYTLAWQVRDIAGNFVDALNITWFADNTSLATVSQATDDWPAGTLLCDVRLTDEAAGTVTYSDTFCLIAQPSISGTLG